MVDGDHVHNERLLFMILIVNTVATVATPLALLVRAVM